MSARKLTVSALFTTLSLAIYGVESALPTLLPIPGIKLGLANIVTLLLLPQYGLAGTAPALAARILLSAILFGQPVSLLYSLAGGIFSLLCMSLCVRVLRDKFLFLSGALGGLAHNLGQLLTAYLITAVPGVLIYLPHLVLAGILTGLFTGLCAAFSLRYLKPLFRK